jgi:hypothetical protein
MPTMTPNSPIRGIFLAEWIRKTRKDPYYFSDNKL